MQTDSEKLELEFDKFFLSIEYQRLAEIIGPSPTYDNADYINLAKKTLIELKILEKDFFKDGGIIHSLQTIVAVPKNISDDGEGFYEVNFPTENREGKVDTLEEPLRRILKKANKQLKETKNNLLGGNGHGFVMLALNMPSTIDPSFIRALVHRILTKEFTSISGVILCTPKVGMIVDGKFLPVCLHTHDSGIPESVYEEMISIVNGWADFIDNGGHA